MKLIDYQGVLVSHESPRENFFKEQLQKRLYQSFRLTLFDLPQIFKQMGVYSTEYELTLCCCSADFLRFFVKTASLEFNVEIRHRLGLAFKNEMCLAMTADCFDVTREYIIKKIVVAKCVRELDSASPENSKDYRDA